MLRLNAWILAIFLIVGQTFASVTVYVDMKQTGPADSNGEIQVRVGKNVNATYSATAGYNGKPTLHDEETIQSTNWTYTVSADSGVVYSPTQSGTGHSVTVTAKNAVAGTYAITVTFSLTFTIKTPDKDSQGNYQYDSNNNQIFTTRTDGQYSGSGSTTLNVKNGKFKIRLEPDDKCKETATNKRSRTRFGLGETGTIIIEPETPDDTVVFDSSTSSSESICITNDLKFTLQNKPGSATIMVLAKVNGESVSDEETCGITAIAPTSMTGISKENWPEWHFVGLFTPVPPNKHAGTGMGVSVRFEPKDVSFAKSKLGEGYASGMLNGKLEEHPKNVWDMPEGDVEKGTITRDGVGTFQDPIDIPAETLVWNIAFGYYDLSNNPSPTIKENPLIPIAVNPQIYTYDGQGGCSVTKFGLKATRVPKNVPNLLKAIRDNTDYTDGWKFID